MRWVLVGLATWRLSHMLVREEGPWKAIEHTRNGVFSVTGTYGPLLCVSCTSVWVGLALTFAPRWLVASLAASGAAKLIEDYLYNGVFEDAEPVDIPVYTNGAGVI